MPLNDRCGVHIGLSEHLQQGQMGACVNIIALTQLQRELRHGTHIALGGHLG